MIINAFSPSFTKEVAHEHIKGLYFHPNETRDLPSYCICIKKCKVFKSKTNVKHYQAKLLVPLNRYPGSPNTNILYYLLYIAPQCNVYTAKRTRQNSLQAVFKSNAYVKHYFIGGKIVTPSE